MLLETAAPHHQASAPSASSGVPAVPRQQQLLDDLQSLLLQVSRALASSELDLLPEVATQLAAIANQAQALAREVAQVGAPAYGDGSRRAISEIAVRATFCRALLRRWRRLLAVRRQLLSMRLEGAEYAESGAD